MNGNLWQVFRYELGRNFRRRGYLFTTFGLPVLIAIGALVLPTLFSGTPARSNNPNEVNIPTELMRQVQHAGYVDETGTFSDPGDLSSVLIPYPDEAAAQAALTAGDIDVYYLISADYFETREVVEVMPRLSITLINSDLIERLLLNYLAQDVEPQIYTRLVNPADFHEVDVARSIEGSSDTAFDTRFLLVYVFALIFMGSLFLTNGYLLQTVIEEKETRLIEILLASLRPFELLAGKIMALGLLGLFQILVWIGAFILMAWISTQASLSSIFPVLGLLAQVAIPVQILPLLFVYFVVGYLLFAALFGVVGALSNSMREGPQYAVIFTLPAAIPLYFLSIFISTPNAPIAVGLSLFPLTAPLSMVQRLVITDVPGWQVALSLGLLALSAVGVMWLAGRLFRVNILLAGQLPKLRDLPRLVRG